MPVDPGRGRISLPDIWHAGDAVSRQTWNYGLGPMMTKVAGPLIGGPTP